MKNVLLVDEDESVRSHIRLLLENAFVGKLKVTDCPDGLDAIRRVEKQKFDCVITDIKLPKCDGNSLLKMMAALPAAFKPSNVLILSSYTADPANLKSYVSYLSKPLKETALISFIVEHVLDEVKKPPFKMDVNFINPFIDSTIEVLRVMADMSVDRDKVFLKEADEVSGDISALVAMTSSKFMGSFAITFEKACFLEIASKMLFEEYTEITSENRDAAGEICNQVFGLTKAKMNDELGLDIAKAIPTIILGDNHTIKHQINGKCLSVRFKTEKGTFCIEAVVRSN